MYVGREDSFLLRKISLNSTRFQTSSRSKLEKKIHLTMALLFFFRAVGGDMGRQARERERETNSLNFPQKIIEFSTRIFLWKKNN